MSFVGDCTAQFLVERRKTFDWKRSLRLTAIGVCVSGPLFGGFGVLTKGYHAAAKQRLEAIIKLAALENVSFVPLVSAIAIGLIGYSQNVNREQIWQNLQDNLWKVVLFTWGVSTFYKHIFKSGCKEGFVIGRGGNFGHINFDESYACHLCLHPNRH